MEENVYGVTLPQLFKESLNRWWIIAICVVICTAALVVYTVCLATPIYKASATLGVNISGDQMSIYQDFVSGQAMSKDYAEVAKSNVTLDRAAKSLNAHDFKENNE